LGWEQILTSRLATLWTGDAMGDVRLDLWSRCWNFVQAFPIWGTGFGTIQHVEPIYAHTPQQVGFIFAYAHNEYLEALVEGGIIRLLLTLLIIGFVFRLGVRALSQQSSFATHGLALGLLFSVTTLTVHSFVEFSIHIPAVALLATVVSALLCNLGDDAGDGETVRNPQGTKDRYVVRLAGLAPFAAAMVAVMLGGVLAFEGWKAARADQLEIAAYRLRQSVGLARLPQQLVYLDAAARLNPWDVRLRYALAQAQLDLYEEQSNNLPPADNDTRQRLKEEHLIHGLRQLLIARDMCPVMAEPHARIAAYVEELSLADPRLVYVDRAKFLAPADPLLWYLAGTLELGDNRPEQAWKSWRRALDLSSDYLQRIMNQSIGHLTPAEILKYVLPDRPEILLAAAEELFPTDRFTTQRQPFLEKCLSLLNESPVVLSTNELFMKARAHMLMDQPNEAIAAFRAGLLQAPEEYSRRYELAELLYQQGNTVDAETQLKMIPSPQRKNAPTQKLLNQIRQDRAKGLGPSALTE
jgi:tetratricopeptide (TPR) repeat protein